MDHAESSSDQLNIQINRPVYDIEKLNQKFGFREKGNEDIPTKLKKLPGKFDCSFKKVKELIFGILPVINWLPKYKWRECLAGDLIAGITIAILQIPLGMGYATLSYLPPIYGIYMAFFPVIVYAIFGSSKHMQMGAFPVPMIMIGSVVEIHRTDKGLASTLLASNLTNVTDTGVIRPVDITTAMCIMAGIWQLIMGGLSIGYLSVFLSDALVSGFTTGAAVHVITSQMKNLLGIKPRNYVGLGKIVLSWISIFEEIPNTNICALIVCLCSLACLVFNNEVIKVKFAGKLPIPVPMELFVVIIATAVSYCLDLTGEYNLKIVGDVPTGFPVPTPPTTSLIGVLMIDSFVIAVVAFVISFSMCRIYAKRDNYAVDPNQELLAHGFSNIVGSFFKCTIMCDAPARSLTSYAVGGKTLIASLISCFILIFVLLFIGPLFRCLPYAALSSIIVAALRGLVLQFRDIVYFWNRSRRDGILWLVTIIGVVFLDIEYGLGIAFAVSIIILLWSTLRPYSSLVAPLPDTEIFMDIKYYNNVVNNVMIRSFRFYGPLHFANREYFRDHIYGRTRFYPTQWKAMMAKFEKKQRKTQEEKGEAAEGAYTNPTFVNSENDLNNSSQNPAPIPTERKISYVPHKTQRRKSSAPDGGEHLAHKRKKKMSLPNLHIPTPNLSSDSTNTSPLTPSSTRGCFATLPIETAPLHKLEVNPFEFQVVQESLPGIADVEGKGATKKPKLPFKFLLIDFSGTCSIDPSGAEMVLTVVNEFQSCEIKVFLCGIAGHVLDILNRIGLMESVCSSQIFSSLEDAYKSAHHSLQAPKIQPSSITHM